MTMSAIATTPATTPPAIAATFELFDELVDVGEAEVKLEETYGGNEAVGLDVGNPKGVDSGAANIEC